MDDYTQAPDAGDRPPVLAFYVVVDVSLSMASTGALAAANAMLPKVADAIGASPALGEVVRFGAIDFSDDARIVLRLGDLRAVRAAPPTFTSRGGTSYAAAFRLLRQEIDSDLTGLRTGHQRVYRPAVFFITDGEPTDDPGPLQSAFAELTDPAFHGRPNIIPFGLGQATKELLDLWVYPKPSDSTGPGSQPMRSYLAREHVDPATAVGQIADILISSVLASAGSPAAAAVAPPAAVDADDWV